MTQQIEFNEYITPDGQIYSLEGINKYMMSIEGEGMPPINYITQRGPFQHGISLTDYFLGPRIIQMLVRQQDCSRQNYWNLRAALLNYLRPNRVDPVATGRLRKYFPDGSRRDIDVLIQQGPNFEPRNLSRWDEYAFQETLRFIAFNPIYYNPTQRVSTATQSGQLVFPITFPITFGAYNSLSITYLGTWLDYPTIELTGPMSYPRFTNTVTGDFIQFNYVIPPGVVVTFSLLYGSKAVTDSLGNNLMGYVSSDSDLTTFSLVPDPIAPNGVNTINIIAGGASVASSIVFKSYDRYIGI